MKNATIRIAAGAALVLAICALPAAAQSGFPDIPPNISDAIWVVDGQGTTLFLGGIDEATEAANPNAFFYTTAIPVDAQQVGHPTGLTEPGPTGNLILSDIYGVANIGTAAAPQFVLGFISDVEGQPLQFSTPDILFPEGNGGWFPASQYLATGLQADGVRAFFFSDGEIPEPSTVALLGAGAVGLVIAARRRRQSA